MMKRQWFVVDTFNGDSFRIASRHWWRKAAEWDVALFSSLLRKRSDGVYALKVIHRSEWTEPEKRSDEPR